MFVDPKTRHDVNQVMAVTPGLDKWWTPLMVLGELFAILMGWFNLSIVVLVRHSFGHRYLSISRIVLGYFTMGFFATLIWFYYGLAFAYGSWLGLERPSFTFNLFPLYTRLYLLLCAYHAFRSWQRQKRGIRWHSRCFGISHLGWLAQLLSRLPHVVLTDFGLYRFLEPICFGLLGLWLRQYDPITGTWLMIAAFALGMESHAVYTRMRTQVDDTRDATIIAEYMEAGHSLTTPKQLTQGYIALPVSTEAHRDEDVLDIAATVNAAIGAPTPEQEA